MQTTWEQSFSKSITIHAGADKVWAALTRPELLRRWMLDEGIDIITDWKVGSPLVIRGELHSEYFENNGKVLRFEPGKLLQYNHLSSLSNLPDEEENYSVITFELQAAGDSTKLIITLNNFPTETIYKHLLFYWNVTVNVLKDLIELHAF